MVTTHLASRASHQDYRITYSLGIRRLSMCRNAAGGGSLNVDDDGWVDRFESRDPFSSVGDKDRDNSLQSETPWLCARVVEIAGAPTDLALPAIWS